MEIPDANRTTEGGTDDVQRRTRASSGDHAIAFAARGMTLRAKIACEREPSDAAVATQLGLTRHTIGKWRNRFIADRIEGLYDEVRPGRPRTIKDEAVATLISKTLARKPEAATHWSVRTIAKEPRLRMRSPLGS